MNLSHINLAVHQTHLFEIRAQMICEKLPIEKKLKKFLQSYLCEDYQISNFPPKFTLSMTLTMTRSELKIQTLGQN